MCVVALLACAIAAPAASGEVVINEVRAAAGGEPSDEFVEIANTGSTVVNLAGWDLSSRDTGCVEVAALRPDGADSTFPETFLIGPDQKALVASPAYTGTGSADVTFEGTDVIASAGAMRLANAASTVVDRVGWDDDVTVDDGCKEGTQVAADLVDGEALTRDEDSTDTDDNATDFEVVNTGGTPEGRADTGGIPPDEDGDAVTDADDNCPSDPNTNQLDLDGDGGGDVCDEDDDGDGVDDVDDNCETTANPDQLDTDGDTIGTACDQDAYDNIAGITTHLTGIEGTLGHQDGELDDASFYDVGGIATDGEDLYVSDTEGKVVFIEGTGFVTLPPDAYIRKIDTETDQVSTVVTPEDFADAAAELGETAPKFSIRDLEYHDGVLYMTGYQAEDQQNPTFEPRVFSYRLSDDTLTMIDPGIPLIDTTGFGGVASDGDSLYVTVWDCNDPVGNPNNPSQIVEIPLAGGPTSVVASFPKPNGAPGECGTLGRIDDRGDNLYVTDREHLYEVKKDDGTTRTLVDPEDQPGLNFPGGLEVTDGVVFVSNDGCCAGSRNLWSVDRETGDAHTTFAGPDCFDGQGNCGSEFTPTMGTGPDVKWAPGAVVQLDGRLYVADRPQSGGPTEWNRHMIREVEILPDAFAPEGSATPSAFAADEAAASTNDATYSIELDAVDTGEGRIPSGLSSVQVRSSTATTRWMPYSSSINVVEAPSQPECTPTIDDGCFNGEPTDVRFSDRASNISDWVALGGDEPPPTNPPGGGGGGGSTPPPGANAACASAQTALGDAEDALKKAKKKLKKAKKSGNKAKIKKAKKKVKKAKGAVEDAATGVESAC